MPASTPDLPTDHTGKLFGIVYITLTGVIDTIVPAAGPWSWVRKSASYLFKLAPLLWWALPAKNLARVTPENNGPAAQDWIPDTNTSSTKEQHSTHIQWDSDSQVTWLSPGHNQTMSSKTKIDLEGPMNSYHHLTPVVIMESHILSMYIMEVMGLI
ncbi:hypothetical protein DSO57_1000859 [Entomophthora muscae]|uniref:Uncharacterized protein n=1 Tax=Entomophthora muscae TaxID=34485 RepID=A0ACC2U7R8_9FUNG|nr:hypothetical protein DSO57_1000859 [Entomophthora muscae]